MRNWFMSLGLLFLRIGMGSYLLTHGWGKLIMLLESKFDQFPDPIGLGNELSLVMIVFAEFVCAMLVILGFATRFAAFTIVIAMGVAAFVVHANDPWVMGAEGSKEPALLYLIPHLALVFTGPGCFSIDHKIEKRRTARTARRQNA